MRLRFGLFGLAAVTGILSFSASRADERDSPRKLSTGDAALKEKGLAAIRRGLREADAANAPERRTLVRITDEPFHVKSPGAGACAPHVLRVNPHGGHWIKVYVTQAGHAPILSGKGTYPEGTMILKQKLSDAEGTRTDLYTGMLKRQKGYNSTIGDWEFFVLDSKATAVTSAGKIESCIGCHKAYRGTDFVSRSYLIEKVAKSD
jgi:hypothetical protein